MWKFLVKNQSIEIVEREILADHQIQYVQFKFTFDGDWKHFHKVVQFSQCDEVYFVVLGTEGTTLYLPAELHAGAAKMAVFGYDTEYDTTVRATTVPVTLNIRESGFEGDDPPIPPTPDLYTQLLKRIEDAEHGLDGKSAYEIAVEHSSRAAELIPLLRNALDGILQYQVPKTKMFLQVVDRADLSGNYSETSGSAMVAYALMKGARLGMLPAPYGERGSEILDAIRDTYLINENGEYHLYGICASAGLGPGPDNRTDRDGTPAYYLSEKQMTDNQHGTGACMMAVSEQLLRNR